MGKGWNEWLRKVTCVNLGIAVFILGLNAIILVTSPSQHLRLWGISLEFIVFPTILAQVLLPPLQTVVSIGLLLFNREARARPMVWLLLLAIVFSLLSGLIVLVGIASVSAAP